MGPKMHTYFLSSVHLFLVAKNISVQYCERWCSTLRPSLVMHPSALRKTFYTTVPIQYWFPRCLRCLLRRRIRNQTSSATMDKCRDLRKYVFPDPCLLDFFFSLVLVGTITSQNIRHFLTRCIIIIAF